MWRDHYESLLNNSTHHDEKAYVLQSFNNTCSHAGMYVAKSEVLEVVKDLPNCKSSGLDGLNGESLKYADPLLCLLLSICYTCMFKHSYMPQSMINSITVLLIKNKCGNLTDKINYRPIALPSITSKVFEHIILLRLANIYGPLIINLVSSQAIQQTSLFMNYLNLLNISKPVPDSARPEVRGTA